MAVVPDGRPSVTGYRVRERFAGWTLLELDLVTGRTHQIRVHLDAIGHPVAGDPVYGTGTSRRGPDGLDRLFLHAWRLELTSPSDGHLIRATAPLPPELEAVLDGLRGRSSVERRCRTRSRTCDVGATGADARHHLGAERGRQGHDHRCAAAPAARPRVPLRRDLHDAGAAARRGRRRRLPLPRPRATFAALRAAGEFLEANEVHGNWYGTPREPGPRGARRPAGT